MNMWSLVVWLHVLAGITWVGLLYYFNFIQIPAAAEAAADSDGPGPAAISKIRCATGVVVVSLGRGCHLGDRRYRARIPAWIGYRFSIHPAKPCNRCRGRGSAPSCCLNVWVLIWPNQKKYWGSCPPVAEEIAKAKNVALLASRTNNMLSIPMLMCMVGYGHNLPF